MMNQAISVDAINETIERAFPGSGARCLEIGDNYAIGLSRPSVEQLRPGGYISGPSQFALLDATLWYATFVALGRIELMALTSELSVRFLRPAIGEELYCRADVEAVSRRSVVLTAHLWCDDRADRPASIAQGTYAIPLPH